MEIDLESLEGTRGKKYVKVRVKRTYVSEFKLLEIDGITMNPDYSYFVNKNRCKGNHDPSQDEWIEADESQITKIPLTGLLNHWF